MHTGNRRYDQQRGDPHDKRKRKKIHRITAVIMSMNAQKITAGGPRRDWKNLSEIKPPANPPTIPKTHSKSPQFARMLSAPGCFTSCPKIVYHCMMPLRSTPAVSS